MVAVVFGFAVPMVVLLAGLTGALPSVDEARREQAAAAGHLLAYVEGRDADGLRKAEECLARIPPWGPDPHTPDRLVSYPVGQESRFLRRVAAWLAGRTRDMDGAEMPQFRALLTYLARDDAWLLRVHLAEVADSEDPSSAWSLGLDNTTMLMIRTLRPERWNLEHRLALAFVGLREGEHVADIGSGSGFFTFLFSAIVGPRGRVHAVDVDQRHLDFIEGTLDTMPFRNVTTSLSTYTQNRLADASVDVVFISNILFGIEQYDPLDKAEFYASVKRILRPGGRFVACDHADTYGGLPRDEAVARLRTAGFTVVDSYGWPAVCIKATK